MDLVGMKLLSVEATTRHNNTASQLKNGWSKVTLATIHNGEGTCDRISSKLAKGVCDFIFDFFNFSILLFPKTRIKNHSITSNSSCQRQRQPTNPSSPITQPITGTEPITGTDTQPTHSQTQHQTQQQLQQPRTKEKGSQKPI
jgi:hypothetical protein